MCRKTFFASCSLFLCVVTAAGQSPGKPAAESGKTSTLIEQRMQFVSDAYGLDDQQTQRLRADLVNLQAIHEAYMSRYKRTLRRQAKAISLVIPQQDEYDAAMRASLNAKIQGEIYKINAKAPLSLANVVSKTEAMLSSGKIERGRRKIAAKYATVLKGKPLNIKTIDRLILKPVAPSSTAVRLDFAPPVAPVNQTAAASPKRKADPERRRRVAPVPNTIRDRAIASRLQQPATPPRPVPPIEPKARPSIARDRPQSTRPPPPAPPTTDWAAAYDASVTKYGFSDKQKLVAQTALKSCVNRAESYLQKNKESLDRAKQAAPSDENARRLTKLRRPIDKLFRELNQRIHSIATIEQVLAAKKKKAQESPAKK